MLKVDPNLQNLKLIGWSDSALHDYNYNETKKMIEDQNIVPGNYVNVVSFTLLRKIFPFSSSFILNISLYDFVTLLSR
jgi:hypothetical protein